MNQEKALETIRYYQNHPEAKNSEAYRFLQETLFTIRNNGVENYVGVLSYALEENLNDVNMMMLIPYDISMMAHKVFKQDHGGIPQEYAGETRSAVGFAYLERFLEMAEEFKVYELFAHAKMNQAREAFDTAYDQEQAMINEKKTIQLQEQEAFEASKIYKYAHYIAYFFFFILLVWTPLSMLAKNSSIPLIILSLLCSLTLLAKNKLALYLYLFLNLVMLVNNGFSGLVTLIAALIFVESHYYQGRHIYNLQLKNKE